MSSVDAKRARSSRQTMREFNAQGRKTGFERWLMGAALLLVGIAALLIVAYFVAQRDGAKQARLIAERQACSYAYALDSDAWNNCVTDGLR